MIVTERVGVVLGAVPLRPGVAYDIPITPPEEGLSKLERGFDRLWNSGPYARAAINRLKKAGRVQIVYDPHFPRSEGANLTLAALLPDFYDPSQDKRNIVILFSRFGIKWSPDEVVGLMAHELLGHGIQMIDGYLPVVRRIDLECGAELFREAIYQGLKVNKHHSNIIKFRKTLEGKWCRRFKEYQGRHAPEGLALWDDLNPDVPGLLAALEKYFQHQIATGEGAEAVRLDRDKTSRQLIDAIRRREGDGAADVLYNVAVRYRDGIEVAVDLEKAHVFFKAAAASGHPTAAVDAAAIIGQ